MAEYVTVSDGEVIKITWRDRFDAWYFGTWLGKFWYYKVRRFPPPPPFDFDPVARHFGFVDGVPACRGPMCQEHEWKVVDR